MRLGQLARKLSLRPAQIVEFLANQGLPLEVNSNTRMEDGLVLLVVKKYAPDSLVTIESELKAIDDEIIEEVEQKTENEVEAPLNEPVEMVKQVGESRQSSLPEIEVIRAPKIELSGLKVLGKIELTVPKKNNDVLLEAQTDSSTTQGELQVRPVKKISKFNEKRDKQKQKRSFDQTWENPLELKREQEAKEAEEKRLIQLAQEKEKRKKYYEAKAKISKKPKRVKPENDEPKFEITSKNKSMPKTWFGKFMRWLTNNN